MVSFRHRNVLLGSLLSESRELFLEDRGARLEVHQSAMFLAEHLRQCRARPGTRHHQDRIANPHRRKCVGMWDRVYSCCRRSPQVRLNIQQCGHSIYFGSALCLFIGHDSLILSLLGCVRFKIRFFGGCSFTLRCRSDTTQFFLISRMQGC